MPQAAEALQQSGFSSISPNLRRRSAPIAGTSVEINTETADLRKSAGPMNRGRTPSLPFPTNLSEELTL